MGYMIEAKGVTFSYDTKNVLESVDISVPQGSFTAILGPNGSGKSTLIRVLAGLAKPKSGEVTLCGRAITEIKPQERSKMLAYVPQDTAVGFDLSVEDIVLMGRHPYIKAFDTESADDINIAHEAMKSAGIFELRSRSIRQISGGERQRAAVARMLAQQAQIALLDEPVSNLDIRHQQDIMGLLKRGTKDGMTAVCVLHDLTLAAHYADYCILLSHGRVFAEGTPNEVLTPENVRAVYAADVRILSEGGAKYIVPKY